MRAEDEKTVERGRKLIAEGEVIVSNLRSRREAAEREVQDLAEREQFASTLIENLRFINTCLESRS